MVMAMNEIMDKERVIALSYVVNKSYGYVRELLANVRESIVQEFVSLGFVIMGYTSDEQTWRASTSASDFLQIVQ